MCVRQYVAFMGAALGVCFNLQMVLAQPVDIEPKSRFVIDDADPVAGVPSESEKNAHPVDFATYLQDILERAEKASKADNHTAASKYYMAVAAAVPDSAVGFSRLCESLAKAQLREQALAACRGALGRKGAKLVDSVRLVNLLLGKDGDLTDAEADEAFAVVEHLKQQDDTKLAAHDLECDVARRLRDQERIASCTAAVAALAPGSPRAVALQWTWAVEKGDKAQAAHWLLAAQDLNLPEETLQTMAAATEAMPKMWTKVLKDWRLLAVAFVAVAAFLFALSFIKKRRATPAPA